MTILEAIFLGVVQGLTEFLPISSSGHLVVFQYLLGTRGPDTGLLFDITVHVGTLVAVLVAYGRDLGLVVRDFLWAVPKLVRGRWREGLERPHARMGLLILVGTVPTAIIGLTLEDTFERLFQSRLAVGFAFLLTGFVLWVAGRLSSGPPSERPVGARPMGRMRLGDALAVGLAQGIAITPGISRSGSTIAAGLLLGLDRDLAARFSFLLAIPAILGALVLEARDGIPATASGNVAVYAAGFVAAALSGYLALRWLLRLLVRGRLGVFAWYLWPLGIAVIAWALIVP